MSCGKELLFVSLSCNPNPNEPFAGPETTVGFAVAAGVAAGLGWAALGLGVVALFERRPWSYLLVNGGYLTVSFAVMGLILGAWR